MSAFFFLLASVSRISVLAHAEVRRRASPTILALWCANWYAGEGTTFLVHSRVLPGPVAASHLHGALTIFEGIARLTGSEHFVISGGERQECISILFRDIHLKLLLAV